MKTDPQCCWLTSQICYKKLAQFVCKIAAFKCMFYYLELQLNILLHQVDPISKRSRLWSYGYFKDALPARHWDGRARDDRDYSKGALFCSLIQPAHGRLESSSPEYRGLQCCWCTVRSIENVHVAMHRGVLITISEVTNIAGCVPLAEPSSSPETDPEEDIPNGSGMPGQKLPLQRIPSSLVQATAAAAAAAKSRSAADHGSRGNGGIPGTARMQFSGKTVGSNSRGTAAIQEY